MGDLRDEPDKIEDWKRISVLGQGSFGIVTLWENSDTRERLAIKKCKLTNISQITPRQRERWQSEVELMKEMGNPNIVHYKQLPEVLDNVLSRFNPSGLPILSMEYCTKGNLRRTLSEPKNYCGLPEENVRYILTDITNAVSFLHKHNVVHRDIKPENIVLQHCDFRRLETIYKIIDLGYAKEMINSQVSFVGTLNYLAPEIFRCEKYNNSVDYWSMGLLFYEVICGVIPFLPERSPVERFEYIKNKHPDHICISTLNGEVLYKTEIVQENHISSCLKEYIEFWLRHVLHYNSSERIKCFSDGSNVFEYLQKILKKKIINVFSLYTSEFYSYEIDESTLVGTLKQWIARDITIPKEELLILSSQRNYDDSPDRLVIDLLKDDDLNLYVIKRGSFTNKEAKHLVSKPVKDLLENIRKKFSWSELRQLYKKTIHYILEQIKTMVAFNTSFTLYGDYVQYISRKMRVKECLLKHEYMKLLLKIDCYNNIRKNVVCNGTLNSKMYKMLLFKYKTFLKGVKETGARMNNLKKKISSVKMCLDNRSGIKDRVYEIIQESVNMDKDLHEACQLLHPKKEDLKSNSFSCGQMFKVVNRIIKKRDAVFFGEVVQNFISGQNSALVDIEGLLDWMKKCQICLQQLTIYVDNLETHMIRALIQHSSIQTMKHKSELNGIKNREPLDSAQLIEENITLRSEFHTMLDLVIPQHKDLNESRENEDNTGFT